MKEKPSGDVQDAGNDFGMLGLSCAPAEGIQSFTTGNASSPLTPGGAPSLPACRMCGDRRDSVLPRFERGELLCRGCYNAIVYRRPSD